MSHLWSTNHVGQKRQRGWLLLLLRAPTQRHDVSAFFSCVCWFPAEVLCVCSHSGSGVKVNHIYLFTLKNLTVNIYTTTVKPSKTNRFFFSHFSFTTWVLEASLWFSAISLVQGWVKPALLLLLLLHKRKWSSVIGRYCPQTWKKKCVLTLMSAAAAASVCWKTGRFYNEVWRGVHVPSLRTTLTLWGAGTRTSSHCNTWTHSYLRLPLLPKLGRPHVVTPLQCQRKVTSLSAHYPECKTTGTSFNMLHEIYLCVCVFF